MLDQRIVPVRLPSQDEVVEASEQAQRRVPVRIGPDDLRGDRIVRVAPTELGIQRRPAVALRGLGFED
jgi:hypothetical protein